MIVETSDTMEIHAPEDIVKVRQAVRTRAVASGFSIVDQTKIVTAASELARNTLDYGGGGKVTIDAVRAGIRKGVRLVFTDQGPGIPDVARALEDGFTTGTGLGLGLSGAKRLSSEFDIQSSPETGTTVTIVRWK